MTVEPTYWDKPSYRIMAKQLDDLLGKEKQLQAIKDAPKCKHGKIDWHSAQEPMHDSFGNKIRPHEYTCKGAPELRSLLANLTEENINRCLTHGHSQSTDPEYCWFGVHNEHHPCKFTKEDNDG